MSSEFLLNIIRVGHENILLSRLRKKRVILIVIVI